MSVVTRELSAQDARAVKDIELLAGLSPWTTEDYESEGRRSDTLSFVAEADGVVIGFVVARFNPPDCELLNVSVRSEFRRLGVGNALLQRLIDEVALRGGGMITLEVREGNEVAKGFYNSNGFHEIGFRKDFYSHPSENAVLLQKIVE